MRTKSKILDRSIRIEWPRNMSAWSHRTAKPWPSKRKSGFLWLSAVIIDEFMEIVNQKHKSRTKKCINRFLSFSTFLFFTSQYYISRSLYIIWNPISSKIQRMMSLFHEAYCLQEASGEKCFQGGQLKSPSSNWTDFPSAHENPYIKFLKLTR